MMAQHGGTILCAQIGSVSQWGSLCPGIAVARCFRGRFGSRGGLLWAPRTHLGLGGREERVGTVVFLPSNRGACPADWPAFPAA